MASMSNIAGRVHQPGTGTRGGLFVPVLLSTILDIDTNG
jgi:hypothetical protein